MAFRLLLHSKKKKKKSVTENILLTRPLPQTHKAQQMKINEKKDQLDERWKMEKKNKNKKTSMTRFIISWVGVARDGWDYPVKTTARKQSSSVDNKVKAQWPCWDKNEVWMPRECWSDRSLRPQYLLNGKWPFNIPFLITAIVSATITINRRPVMWISSRQRCLHKADKRQLKAIQPHGGMRAYWRIS